MRTRAYRLFPALILAGALGVAQASEPDWQQAAERGFVETADGEQIHYLALGERSNAGAPALLFVPGWTMTVEIWAPQLEYFAERYRVAAMDPRSQGRSSKAREGHFAAARARDIRAMVEALDLEPVVLIGWSMGVTEVVAYAEQFGTSGVAGLVLVDGIAGMDWEDGMARMFMHWTAGFIHDRPKATREFVAGMYREPQTEEYLERVAEQAMQTPTDSAAALISGTVLSDFRAALPNIDRPVLVAATTGSPWDPLYAEMAEAIPDARLEWFEGAGHALFVDRAEEFNRLLEAFIAGLGQPGPEQ